MQSVPTVADRNMFFAAPADDPRARRPVDIATLATSLTFSLLMGWAYWARVDLDVRVLTFFQAGMPGWLTGIATLAYIAGGLYTVGIVVGIAVLGHGRGAIARDIVLAVAVAFAGVVIAAYVFGPEFPDVLPELLERDGFPSYPVVRLAAAVAAIRVASPYLSLPMRKIGGRIIFGMALAALVLSYGTVSAVLGAFSIGLAASAAIHLVFGSGLGIPSKARIIAALAQAHITVDDIDYLDQGTGGVFLVRAHQVDGDDLRVKVYGRDAADSAFASRLWRSVWYRNADASMSVNSEQLAEHECLVLLTMEREHVAGPELVGWGKADTGDSLVVTRWADGSTLSDLDAESVDEAMLDRIWGALTDLHANGITHGAIDADRVIVSASAATFDDFENARIFAPEAARQADQVQVLVATATTVGSDRAIAAARRARTDEAIAELLPFVQTAALPHDLEHQTRQADLKVRKLREQLADALGVPAPQIVKLQRVSWGSVAMAALTLFAFYTLLSSLLDIGIDTIVDEMSTATWSWVFVAAIFAQLTNVGEYFSLSAVMGRPIPFGPTMMFRYALSFISLAVPSEAGAIAMNIRYQQKLGVPAAAAIAQGPLLTVFSKGFDVILLLITARFLGQALDTENIDMGPLIKLIVVIIVLAIVAVVVVFAVPKFRHLAMPPLKQGFGAVKGSLTDPHRLFKLIGGTLFQKMCFAIALGCSVAAYGTHITFSEAIFVNSAVSLLIGFVPIPGGIGVAEAALTAGLVAVGVPESVALAAAITHRMLTAYLPPVFGWWSSRWLIARDLL